MKKLLTRIFFSGFSRCRKILLCAAFALMAVVSLWCAGAFFHAFDVPKFVAWLAVIVLFALLAAGLTGCGTTQTLAEGVAEKSLSGSGTVAIQRVGVDPETKTPVLKSTVITGDYASARNGDYAFQYRRRKSPSIFNAEAVTEEVTINYIGTKKYAATALELAKQDVAAAKEPTEAESAQASPREKK